MDKKELTEKLNTHKDIIFLREEFKDIFKSKTLELVGGAILDIIFDKVPKDYDLICSRLTPNKDIVKLIENGWIYLSDTKTAITLVKKGIHIQFLKTKKENFDYTISQATYDIRGNDLEIDEISLKEKTLIPTSFDNPEIAKDCLFRLFHYRKKGFDIKEITYLSLLNASYQQKKQKEQLYYSS